MKTKYTDNINVQQTGKGKRDRVERKPSPL